MLRTILKKSPSRFEPARKIQSGTDVRDKEKEKETETETERDREKQRMRDGTDSVRHRITASDHPRCTLQVDRYSIVA